MLTTTLNRIRAHEPCKDGWRKLLTYLGKTEADDAPLPFAIIVESNGLDDALWCARAEPQYEREWRLFAVWCARQVQHLMTDPRSVAAIEVAERYANGAATKEELLDACNAAWAARAAAQAAAFAAAEDAAYVAALAGWGAAEAAQAAFAARVANSAAWASVYAAASAAESAAEDAAHAPESAAESAAFAAAYDAAGSVAWRLAWAVPKFAQSAEFLRIAVE